jgi:major type 1 subunit fimbrin (pilin)
MNKTNRSAAKKTLFVVASITALGMLAMSGAAAAVDGTITITGQVTASTCKVGNGSPNNFTVALPSIATSALNGVGTVAAATPFSIQISGCGTSGSPSKVATYFEPGPTIDTSTGNLINQASGGATGVQVQLLNGTGSSASAFSPIKLGAASGSQNSGTFAISSGGTATLNYYAQYYQSLASVGAGAFNSSVQYSMFYQ